MLHGVQHLLCMDHETYRGAMGRTARRWMKRFDLPESIIARVRK
jgi:hypothetical protein